MDKQTYRILLRKAEEVVCDDCGSGYEQFERIMKEDTQEEFGMKCLGCGKEFDYEDERIKDWVVAEKAFDEIMRKVMRGTERIV